MSQMPTDHIKTCVLDHYQLLCAAFESAPTVAQIEEISLSAGTHKSAYVDRHFEYALLYFLQRSAIVFEEDTLLLGWLHNPNGAKQEIWYKLDDTNEAKNSSRLYSQRGAPSGSGHWARYPKPLCDEWHPSLAAICTPSICDSREMRYAYLTSTVRLMRVSTPPASIEDFIIRGKRRLTVTLKRAATGESPSQNAATTGSLRPRLTQEHSIMDTRLEKGSLSNQDEALGQTEDATANSNRSTRIRNRNVIESGRSTRTYQGGDLNTDRKRFVQSVVIDLTESEPETDIKSGIFADSQPQQPITQAEQQVQELRNKLHSKTVTEIKTTLAEHSGQLPAWIEDVINQELGTKMLHDLGRIKSLF
jgi:hypothetical protein